MWMSSLKKTSACVATRGEGKIALTKDPAYFATKPILAKMTDQNAGSGFVFSISSMQEVRADYSGHNLA